MNRWAIWALILGPVLVIGAAALLIVRDGDSQSASIVTAGEQEQAQMLTVQSSIADSSAIQKEDALLLQATRQAELEHLRIENERLRAELIHIQKQADQKQQASSTFDADHLLLNLQSFSEKFVSLLPASDERANAELNSTLEFSVPPSKVSYKLESVDIKKTDSAINPLIGEIVFLRSLQSSEDPQIAGYGWYRLDRYTIQVKWNPDTMWSLLSGQSRCETHISFPKTVHTTDDTGKVQNLALDWRKDVFVLANNQTR